MKLQALILSAVTTLAMCTPALAHCHGGWGYGGYGGYGYGPGYGGNGGFLSYLINGNPPGYSYFRRYNGWGGGYGGGWGGGWRGGWGNPGRHLGWYRHHGYWD